MTSPSPVDVSSLIERLRSPKQWCCIFEHEGQMRHGNTRAPYEAADELERLNTGADALREALGRIASNGFGHPTRNIDPKRDKEMLAMMDCARAALKQELK